jgi:hypothetical protein
METDEDRRQEAKDQEYQAIWGVGRESGLSKAEAINAMMMIITVGSNRIVYRVNMGSTSQGVPRDERRMGEAAGNGRAGEANEPEFVTSQRNVGSERAGQECLEC